MIDFIDLFSGIGGFRYGLERIGNFRCVWSCDIKLSANKIYTKRFQTTERSHLTGNIRGINPEELPDFDLLCGGFPCQTFSVTGKRKGFKDTRGTLFFEICRITEVKRPTLLLLENVEGLLKHDEGRTFTIILKSLEELGYWIEWQVFNSKFYGLPQNRPRVFIIGHNNDRSTTPILPLEAETNGSLKLTHKIEGRTPSGISRMTDRMYSVYGIAPCLTASFSGKVNITELKRNLTPIECERLQGFPDNWTYGLSDGLRYELLGNTVSIPVIETLGRKILSSFTNKAGNDGV